LKRPGTDMFWITGGIILLAALPALLNIRVAPLELIANLRPQVIVLALAFGCAAFTVGRHWAVGASVLVAAALLVTTPEFFLRPPRPVQQPALTVVWCNVFKTDAVVERLANVARRRGADIVILGEPPRELAAARRSLAEYPFVYGAPDPDEHGAVVFSRTPLKAIVGPDLGRGTYPLTIVEADNIRIVAMHPPVAVTRSALEGSAVMMGAAVRQAQHGRTLVVGDMNATPWASRLRAVSTEMTRLSPALGSTWFSSLPVLGLPIDHAFVTMDLRASAHVGPGVGSDHLPLIVSIARD